MLQHHPGDGQEIRARIESLDTLHLQGWGGVDVGYLGYTECTLEIPEIKGFKEDVLLLVVNNTEYGDRVPILLGMLHIDMILEKATLQELKQLPMAWRRGSVGSLVLVKQAQLEQQNGILDLNANVKLQ